MTIEELIAKLNEIADRGEEGDRETDHAEADDLLVKYINDARVTDAFQRIDKWYS